VILKCEYCNTQLSEEEHQRHLCPEFLAFCEQIKFEQNIIVNSVVPHSHETEPGVKPEPKLRTDSGGRLIDERGKFIRQPGRAAELSERNQLGDGLRPGKGNDGNPGDVPH